jgi:S1-C subfamily serine protease
LNNSDFHYLDYLAFRHGNSNKIRLFTKEFGDTISSKLKNNPKPIRKFTPFFYLLGSNSCDKISSIYFQEKTMKTYPSNLFLVLFAFAVLFLPISLFAQNAVSSSDTLPKEKIIEKAMSPVVLILTSNGTGTLDKTGSGIVIRGDGVILTAYHVIKDANQVQIRLKNGEIYDKVDLLGFDERRDVAAIKIAATNLSAATINSADPQIGGKVFVVSNPQNLAWTIADGLLNAVRMADELPNAGRGFRVLQFSAPVSSGSSGGVLTNEKGEAIGLIVASLSSGQNLNFAIPLSSVEGLASSPQTLMSFGRATQLELPQAVRPPSTIDIVNADPKALLRNARIFYIYSNSELINEKMMENALMKLPEFEKWNSIMVKDIKLADIVVNVEHDLFTFDYRYSMTDRRTNIVLATGKVTVWDGKIASKKFAKLIVAKLKQIKEAPNQSENVAEKNK